MISAIKRLPELPTNVKTMPTRIKPTRPRYLEILETAERERYDSMTPARRREITAPRDSGVMDAIGFALVFALVLPWVF
jgi:hypothetical protein